MLLLFCLYKGVFSSVCVQCKGVCKSLSFQLIPRIVFFIQQHLFVFVKDSGAIVFLSGLVLFMNYRNGRK